MLAKTGTDTAENGLNFAVRLPENFPDAAERKLPAPARRRAAARLPAPPRGPPSRRPLEGRGAPREVRGRRGVAVEAELHLGSTTVVCCMILRSCKKFLWYQSLLLPFTKKQRVPRSKNRHPLEGPNGHNLLFFTRMVLLARRR